MATVHSVVSQVRGAYSALAEAIDARKALAARQKDEREQEQARLSAAEQAIAEVLPPEQKVAAWRAGVAREDAYHAARAAMRAADVALAEVVAAQVVAIDAEATDEDAAILSLGIEAVASLAYRAAQKARR